MDRYSLELGFFPQSEQQQQQTDNVIFSLFPIYIHPPYGGHHIRAFYKRHDKNNTNRYALFHTVIRRHSKRDWGDEQVELAIRMCDPVPLMIITSPVPSDMASSVD